MRQPIFAILLLLALIYRIIICTSFQANDAEYAQLIEQRYSDLSLIEVSAKLDEDIEDSDKMLARDLTEEYQAGKITMEEYREWESGFEDRLAENVALKEIQKRVQILTGYSEMISAAREGEIIAESSLWSSNPERYIRAIADWIEPALINDMPWELVEEMENLLVLPYILILLLVPMFSELRDTGMNVLMKTTRIDDRRIYTVKLYFAFVLILALWAFDTALIYLLPRLYVKLDIPDCAAQSIPWLSALPYPWTIKQYLIAASLTRLFGCLCIMGLCALTSSLSQSTVVSLTLSGGIFGLFHMFSSSSKTIDKLFIPFKYLAVQNWGMINSICFAILLYGGIAFIAFGFKRIWDLYRTGTSLSGRTEKFAND